MLILQNMLMQIDGKKILLLPAWPMDWNVRFKLHAPLRTTIEGEYRDGQITSLRVTPESRRADIVVQLRHGDLDRNTSCGSAN